MKNQMIHRLRITMRSRSGLASTILLIGAFLFLSCNLRSEDEPATRAVGVRQHSVFGPLVPDAPKGNAGMFVGVNEFTEDTELSRLAYAVHDAIETAYVFVFELKLIPASNCHVLVSGKPTSDLVQKHLEQLQQAGAHVLGANQTAILKTFDDLTTVATGNSDVFVCSMSSHGFTKGRTPYVMPSDGYRRRLDRSAVPLDEIENSMEQSKAGHKLLIVDACQARVNAKGVGAAGTAASNAFIEALKEPSGQIKFASCSPGEFSFENGNLGGVGHGVFTYALLEALRGGAKSDADDIVRLGAVADFVTTTVNAWTTAAGHKTHQTPFLAGPNTSRNLPLATKADDLTSLIATVQKHPLTNGLTDELRLSLADALSRSNPLLPGDRELIVTTHRFTTGQLAANTFLPYAREQIDRLRHSGPAKPTQSAGSIELLVAPFSAQDATKSVNAWARALGRKVEEVNSIGMKLVLIPPGNFKMGSSREDIKVCVLADDDFNELYIKDERPQHAVRISQPFYMSRFEITQQHFDTVMGRDLSEYSTTGPDPRSRGEVKGLDTSDFPAHNMSWYDAVEFCNTLNELEKLTPHYRIDMEQRKSNGSITHAKVYFLNHTAANRRSSDSSTRLGYRLPTEAEWEFACRAGTTTPFHFGTTSNGIMANVYGRSPFGASEGPSIGRPVKVGSYSPNAFGLYDMHGNVSEWCECKYDYGHAVYSSRTQLAVDPKVRTESGSERVVRGGQYISVPRDTRSASRDKSYESLGRSYTGFRVILPVLTGDNGTPKRVLPKEKNDEPRRTSIFD